MRLMTSVSSSGLTESLVKASHWLSGDHVAPPHDFFHKGKGESGTHIVSLQNADATGLTVDDPYGKMREDYRANKAGDAYALAGKGRANSGLSNAKHNGATGTDATDWKVSAAQGRSGDESRGDSNHRSDEQVKSMLNYVTFFRRPSQKKADK